MIASCLLIDTKCMQVRRYAFDVVGNLRAHTVHPCTMDSTIQSPSFSLYLSTYSVHAPLKSTYYVVSTIVVLCKYCRVQKTHLVQYL